MVSDPLTSMGRESMSPEAAHPDRDNTMIRTKNNPAVFPYILFKVKTHKRLKLVDVIYLLYIDSYITMIFLTNIFDNLPVKNGYFPKKTKMAK